MPDLGAHPGFKGRYIVIEDDVMIGENSTIWHFVYLGAGVRIGSSVTIGTMVHLARKTQIGDGTSIQANACIGHYTCIGRDCFIGPGVIINSDPYPPVRRKTGFEAWSPVVIEDDAIIGAGAILNAGVTVGRRAVVGMGAQVVSDVPPETVVLGAPARPIYGRKEYDQRQQEWVAAWREKVGVGAAKRSDAC